MLDEQLVGDGDRYWVGACGALPKRSVNKIQIRPNNQEPPGPVGTYLRKAQDSSTYKGI